MDKIVINGGKPLFGEIQISGMKNAAVAIIMACLLVEDKVVLEKLPNISDVSIGLELLRCIGASVKMRGKGTYEIDATKATGGSAPYELVRKMRASSYILGAELGRFGRAYVGYPGGCDFGVRPIDQHIKGFEALGAQITVEGGYISAEAPKGGLRGAQIYLDCVTVGATVNIILAATRTPGVTIIENAAREPHIVDLANFLNTCGANISGAGTDTIKIKGVSKLSGCTYAIIPDMIEAGTYMIAAAATGGKLKISNVIPKHLESISAKLIEMGVDVEEMDDAVIVTAAEELTRINVKTLPYPGFPTDMNPQIGVLMCLAQGTSVMTESVTDNRFRYVDELRRMGAAIKVDSKLAIFEGGAPLSAAVVRAVDLRAGAAMVIAGLAIAGRTEVEDIQHIERGYEDMVEKLQTVGADIKVITIPDTHKYEAM